MHSVPVASSISIHTEPAPAPSGTHIDNYQTQWRPDGTIVLVNGLALGPDGLTAEQRRTEWKEEIACNWVCMSCTFLTSLAAGALAGLAAAGLRNVGPMYVNRVCDHAAAPPAPPGETITLGEHCLPHERLKSALGSVVVISSVIGLMCLAASCLSICGISKAHRGMRQDQLRDFSRRNLPGFSSRRHQDLEMARVRGTSEQRSPAHVIHVVDAHANRNRSGGGHFGTAGDGGGGGCGEGGGSGGG